MNPLLQESVASVIRSILKLGSGYLVARGVWTDNDATTYVAAAALAIVGFAWSQWTTYKNRQKIVVAAAMASKTEIQIENAVAFGQVPSTMSEKSAVPVTLPKP